MISSAIMIASAMSHEWRNNDEFSWFWNLSRYDAVPILRVFVVSAIIGFIVSVWGLIERRSK